MPQNESCESLEKVDSEAKAHVSSHKPFWSFVQTKHSIRHVQGSSKTLNKLPSLASSGECFLQHRQTLWHCDFVIFLTFEFERNISAIAVFSKQRSDF